MKLLIDTKSESIVARKQHHMGMSIVALVIALGAAASILVVLTPVILRAWQRRRARRISPELDGTHFSSVAAAQTEYPKYVLPVSTLIDELDAFCPHEQLLAEGKLVQATADMASQIIFISHQWYVVMTSMAFAASSCSPVTCGCRTQSSSKMRQCAHAHVS